MEPYYERDGIQIFLGDCRDVLPTLAPRAAGMIMTDPPYAEKTHAGARTAHARKTHHVKDRLIDFDSMTEPELRECFNLFGRIADGWVVSFMDWRHIYHFEEVPPTGLRFVRFGIWTKPNGAPQFTGDRPATGWEAIAIMHRDSGRMKWNGGGYPAVWECHVDQQGDHPAAKPIALVAKLIKLFSQPGDLVLDPFMGGGTTLRAAKMLGRRAVGVELDERYCEIAARRLSQSVILAEPTPEPTQARLEIA